MPTPGTSTIARVGSADRGRVLGGVCVVIGLVVLAVRGVQFLEPRDRVLDRSVGRKVEHQGLDLGAQEVVGATGAQGRQPGVLRVRKEVEHHVGVA